MSQLIAFALRITRGAFYFKSRFFYVPFSKSFWERKKIVSLFRKEKGIKNHNRRKYTIIMLK